MSEIHVGYTAAMVRYITSANPTAVLSVQTDLYPNPSGEESLRLIDVGTTASLAFPNDVTASIFCHTFWSGWGPFGILPRYPDLSVVVDCEAGSVKCTNFVLPHVFHSIIVKPTGKRKRVETAYKFKDGKSEDWWSS